MRRILLLAALLVVGITTSLAAQGTVMPTPRIQLFTDSGAVCAGCSLYAFTAGTSTPLNTYSEVTLTTANAHPIVLDSAGRATVYLSQASYRFRLDSAAGVTIWTQDNVTAMPGSSSTITSTGDLTFQVDTDNNGTNIFTFRDGTNSERFQIAESGNVQLDGTLTVGDNAHSASAAGVSGWNIAAHTTTLTGANPTTYATFYASQINLMTLAGTNANQTVTDAAGLAIAPPAESTNVILTNTHGLLVPTTAVSTATNAYGITVNVPTGATNNYTAAFLGGNVGIGTAAPGARLDVREQSIIQVDKTDVGTAQANTHLSLRGATTTTEELYLGFDTTVNDGVIQARDFGVAYRNLSLQPEGGNVGIGVRTASSKLDITTTALGVTQTTDSGLALVNTTAAAAGAQQISPALRWSGFGWKTDAVAASQAVAFRSYVVPVEGAANPTGYLTVESSINAAAYANRFTIASSGNVGVNTIAPSDELHVKGDVRIEDSTDTTTRDIRLVTSTAGLFSIIDSVGPTTRAVFDTAQNLLIRAAAVGTNGVGVLALGNGTVPATSPVDMIQIFSVDNPLATLGLRTEQAVAADVVAASTHTLRATINGTTYRILLATP